MRPGRDSHLVRNVAFGICPTANHKVDDSHRSRMSDVFLSPKQASVRLGIAVTTFYDWLGQSDWGILVIRGERVTIRYYQGGPGGQGKIQIDENEVDRIRELMRVVPQVSMKTKSPLPRDSFPGIRVRLGRPTDIT